MLRLHCRSLFCVICIYSNIEKFHRSRSLQCVYVWGTTLALRNNRDNTTMAMMWLKCLKSLRTHDTWHWNHNENIQMHRRNPVKWLSLICHSNYFRTFQNIVWPTVAALNSHATPLLYKALTIQIDITEDSLWYMWYLKPDVTGVLQCTYSEMLAIVKWESKCISCLHA